METREQFEAQLEDKATQIAAVKEEMAKRLAPLDKQQNELIALMGVDIDNYEEIQLQVADITIAKHKVAIKGYTEMKRIEETHAAGHEVIVKNFESTIEYRKRMIEHEEEFIREFKKVSEI